MEECIPPSRLQKKKEFLILLFYEKSIVVVVRFRAQIISGQFKEKFFSV